METADAPPGVLPFNYKVEFSEKSQKCLKVTTNDLQM
jgi:hypothetical protein